MPLDVAAYIGHEACAGLDFAHRKKDSHSRPLNIVHRDVSPQNVLVSYDGEVKLVDFGIAKAALRAYETEAGIIKGKFYYMSPEQARGEVLDHRTDIFSIGIVLYECITGELLYKDDDDITLLSQVRRADIKPPSLIRPDIPDRLERIVLRALSRDREDRYPSAQHMQRDLARFLRGYDGNFNRDKLARFMGELYGAEVSGSVNSMGESDFLHAEDSAIGIASFDEAELTRTEGEPEAGDSSVLELDSGVLEYVDDSESGVTAGPLNALDPSIQTMNEDVDSEDFFDDEPTMAYDKPIEEVEAPPSVVIEKPEPVRPFLVSPAAPGTNELRGSAGDEADFNEQPTSMLDEAELALPHPADKHEPEPSPHEVVSPVVAPPRRMRANIQREWIYIGIILMLVMVAAALLTRHLTQDDKRKRTGASHSQSKSTNGIPKQEKEKKDSDTQQPGSPLKADRQTAVLIIESTPNGAQVEINGQPAAGFRTPTRDDVPAGQSVRVRVFKSGFSEHTTEVILRGGETRRIPVKLAKNLGTLEITASPRGGVVERNRSFTANVSINGKPVGKTPRTLSTLDIPGTYRVRVTKDGFKPYEVTRSFETEARSRTKYVDAILEPIDIAPIADADAPRKTKKVRRNRSRSRAKKKRREPKRRFGTIFGACSTRSRKVERCEQTMGVRLGR